MLVLKFVKYAEIEELDSDKRIEMLIDHVKSNKIIILEGRLKKHEEADLIRKTMEEIDQKFKGIELGVIYPDSDKNKGLIKRLKKELINMILGDRNGLTIIGPANIVSEIRQDPSKIELFMKEEKKDKSDTEECC